MGYSKKLTQNNKILTIPAVTNEIVEQIVTIRNYYYNLDTNVEVIRKLLLVDKYNEIV